MLDFNDSCCCHFNRTLVISNVKVLQEMVEPEQTYVIYGKIENTENNPKLKENNVVVRMNAAFPIDRLTINTKERNFQRSVDVQIKRDKGDWQHWARGTIFSFDTANMHESQLKIDIPTVSAKEFRLVFKNFDSPPHRKSTKSREVIPPKSRKRTTYFI